MITDVVNSALNRYYVVTYSKYHDFMDGQDICYIALIFSPRYKTRLLEQELGDAAKAAVRHIKEVPHQQYPLIPSRHPTLGSATSVGSKSASTTATAPPRQKLEARLLAKIQRSTSLESDIVQI